MIARERGTGEHADPELLRAVRAAAQAAVAERSDATVAAVYLYGSAASGRRTSLSDVDIAVLFRDDVPEDVRWKELPSLGTTVARALSGAGPDVDVHDLEALPLAVQGRVLTEGELLCSRGEERRVRFEERTRRRYFDFLPFQRADTEEGLQGLRERLAGG